MRSTLKYPYKLLLITKVQQHLLEVLKQHIAILALSRLLLSFTVCILAGRCKCLGPTCVAGVFVLLLKA